MRNQDRGLRLWVWWFLARLQVRIWLNRARAWWWKLWTGDASREATRRRLEFEARRFGGRVEWLD
jgi:hypothetical protein